MEGLRDILHRLTMFAVGFLLFLAGKLKYRVYVTGLGEPPETPGIMTTNNHQRDWDIVLIAADSDIDTANLKNIRYLPR